VIEAELQEVLNTLTEQDFQGVFKQMAEMLEMVNARVRRQLRG
jgi:hypothetical protein